MVRLLICHDSPQITKEVFLEHLRKEGIREEAAYVEFLSWRGLVVVNVAFLTFLTLQMFERLFDAMDVDGSGIVDREEFLAAMAIISKGGSAREKLHC